MRRVSIARWEPGEVPVDEVNAHFPAASATSSPIRPAIARSWHSTTAIYGLEHSHPSSIDSLVLRPDRRFLATGGADRKVVRRDSVTFEPQMAFPELDGDGQGPAFTPPGRWLAYD